MFVLFNVYQPLDNISRTLFDTGVISLRGGLPESAEGVPRLAFLDLPTSGEPTVGERPRRLEVGTEHSRARSPKSLTFRVLGGILVQPKGGRFRCWHSRARKSPTWKARFQKARCLRSAWPSAASCLRPPQEVVGTFTVGESGPGLWDGHPRRLQLPSDLSALSATFLRVVRSASQVQLPPPPPFTSTQKRETPEKRGFFVFRDRVRTPPSSAVVGQRLGQFQNPRMPQRDPCSRGRRALPPCEEGLRRRPEHRTVTAPS
jgi:hypothetical protein